MEPHVPPHTVHVRHVVTRVRGATVVADDASKPMWKEFGRLTGRDGDVKADCTQRLRDVLDRVKLETGCGGLPFSPLALDELLPDIQENDQRSDVEVALTGEPGAVEEPAQQEVEPERDPVQALRANTRRTISRARAGQPQKKGPRRRPADF
ncbi:hypothetical protein FJT64_009482 [Amphibalanus amphitrite]|uniref:Uncharacterized protein n=1 Tax=Amphibalanus amphitrite TaxID=1232801 RepID=A0A6A4VT95_AMPAM|nr:hypothetical protein FJT64_009482 [Amphibalanus amphitrite]